MKLRELWNKSSEQLATITDNGRADARLLLMYLLKINYAKFIIDLEKEVELSTVELMNVLIKRMLEHEPLQYIIGEQEFMGLMFKVNKDTLIPRGDTEILVNKVINLSSNFDNPKILDIGTGSGTIIISLAKYLKNAQFYAVDISCSALQVAKENAKKHKVLSKISFLEGDLLNPVISMDLSFDIVVSNPPYIDKEEMQDLSKSVLKEPHLALYGGVDGLDFYRRIAIDSKKVLNNYGYLAVEIGYKQSKDVVKIMSNNGYKNIEILKDYAGHDRVVVGKIKKDI